MSLCAYFKYIFLFLTLVYNVPNIISPLDTTEASHPPKTLANAHLHGHCPNALVAHPKDPKGPHPQQTSQSSGLKTVALAHQSCSNNSSHSQNPAWAQSTKKYGSSNIHGLAGCPFLVRFICPMLKMRATLSKLMRDMKKRSRWVWKLKYHCQNNLGSLTQVL